VRFIGRDAELHVLQRAFRSPRSELIPIYGRRRVGKSELILKFMAHKPGLYYLGQQSSTALQQLTGLGYLRRRYPLERQPPNPRHVRFGIDDPLLRFWFRFVFPNVSVIRAGGPARAFADRISSSLDAWFGSCFERLCREALPLIYAAEGITAGFDVGEYWSTQRRNTAGSTAREASPATQIDVVGLRDDNWTDLGECKWGQVRSAPALEAELDGRIPDFPEQCSV
jgi:AAA+ ATPase superfamily predicted ATPase